MSWFFNNSEEKKTSDFFKGINIFDKLKESIYGQIKTSINNIFEYDFTKDYILPKIIIMGNESSGKSCLLENIIKCQIFPRGTGICTKCPIHLKLITSEIERYSVTINDKEIILKNKNEIYDIVKDNMDNMELTDKEIIISISEKNLPTFDFYDLPGIVSYPTKDAKKTRNITKKYLMENNLIVLCVVPATMTRLTCCNSIALIQKLKLEKNTILALTMADRVQFNNIPELLINRILKTSDEIQNLNFNSCVAVVNRTHNDVYSLEENDENEIKWFKNNLINNIPDSHKNEGKIISENITINNLIKKIDLLYSKYIEKEWKPNVMEKILDKKKLLINEIDEIGFINITDDIINQIYHKIFDKCNIENIFDINKVIDYDKTCIVASDAYAKLANGCVITWGNKDNGGDSSAVQHLLKDVQNIYSTHYAFAALLKNGNVVTWGHQNTGGNSSSVQHLLKNVVKIYSTSNAFAALLENGSVVTWGNPSYGGIDSSTIQHLLKNVVEIYSTSYDFAALLKNGSVVTWGNSSYGYDLNDMQYLLKNVVKIYSTSNAFAALLKNGSVVTWGNPNTGGDSSSVQHLLKDVIKIYSTSYDFAALLKNGCVVTWGHPSYGGSDSSTVQHLLKNVVEIYSTSNAFAAILKNGNVVTWGNQNTGGDSSTVQHLLKDVIEIYSTSYAFAALLKNGSVVTWGQLGYGSDSRNVQHLLKDVVKIYSTRNAFAALLKNGNIITWGNAKTGGDSSNVQHLLKDIQNIYSTNYAFAALLKNSDITSSHTSPIMNNNSIYTKSQKYDIIDNVINNLDFYIFENKIDNIIHEIFNDQCNLKLNRFSLLKNEISKMIKTEMQKIFNEKIRKIKIILSNKLGSYIIENNDPKICDFQRYINNSFNNLILNNFKVNFNIKIDKKLIVEDEQFILLRSKLNDQINNVDLHYNKIKKLKFN